MPTWPLGEIQELLEPTLSHMGYSIYSLEQAGNGGRTLRIAIDKPVGFISLDDCERVSGVAGPLLDQADLIRDSYTLEVSSPGLDRPLKKEADFARFDGQEKGVVSRPIKTGPVKHRMVPARQTIHDLPGEERGKRRKQNR